MQRSVSAFLEIRLSLHIFAIRMSITRGVVFRKNSSNCSVVTESNTTNAMFLTECRASGAHLVGAPNPALTGGAITCRPFGPGLPAVLPTASQIYKLQTTGE